MTTITETPLFGGTVLPSAARGQWVKDERYGGSFKQLPDGRILYRVVGPGELKGGAGFGRVTKTYDVTNGFDEAPIVEESDNT